jgi:hypothetical protein
MGVVRMLQEGTHQFDILDSESEFSPYKVLILADNITVSNELKIKLEDYIAKGGSVIATFESGLDPEKKDFNLKELGVRKKSDGPIAEDGKPVRGRPIGRHAYAEYIIPSGPIGKGLEETEHVMYMKGMQVATLPGSRILLNIVESYFNRTWEHFCSHRQTPSSGEIGNPAVVKNGQVIYFAHPLFTQYQKNAPRWCKVMFLNALNMLLADPMVKIKAPNSTLAAVNEQKENNRWILHLLHYIPERKGNDFDIVEDVIPLYDVNVSVRVPRRVKKVTMVPQNKNIKATTNNGRIEFNVPELVGHQMITLSF